MVDTILQRVPLVLEYPVVFTRDLFEPANAALADVLARREPERRHRFVAVVDAGVAAAWPGLATAIEAYAAQHATRVELAAPPWHIPGGEAAKDRPVLDALVERFASLRLDRHAFVVGIGGGAALDVIGYAAAIVHRGLRLVRVPTTVLAQNDAGIGVKNGINAFGAKNFLGTFAAPFAVVNDSRFLGTLGQRDQLAGMAEAVKVALIRDAVFFDWLESRSTRLAAFELEAVEQLIRRCAELHLAHIAGGGDPFEQGNARPLDFGHWAAHKLELLTNHELRHGEAVAIGMAVDATYSRLAGLLAPEACVRVLALLRTLGLATWHPALREPALLGGLAEFREHLGGELTITLLHGIGHGMDAHEIDDALVRRAIADRAVKIGGSHLTYCTNIHRGETWAEVRANVERYTLAVKARVCPDRPFGVGLRLSSNAADELYGDLVSRGTLLADFKAFLDANGLYVFTINGFPYGTFHGEPVKERVYEPDWIFEEEIRFHPNDLPTTIYPRGAYTTTLAHILARLLPDGVVGSISTMPGMFRAGTGDGARVARRLAHTTWVLAALERTSGKRIVVGLEPEPGCMLETTADAIAFFTSFVVDKRQPILETGDLPDRRYLGICLDACHAAVEFEDAAGAVAALRAASVPIVKAQLSCGLRVEPVDDLARRDLARFAEDVYLHQVVARRGATFARYIDLPAALGDSDGADEWRIHFHVPIFREALGRFKSTQPFLAELLASHKAQEISPHLEVETYTWDVLPAEHRAEPIEDAIARELRWVMERLA